MEKINEKILFLYMYINIILIFNREEKRVKISDIENIQTSPKQQSNIQIQIHLMEEEKEFLV